MLFRKNGRYTWSTFRAAQYGDLAHYGLQTKGSRYDEYTRLDEMIMDTGWDKGFNKCHKIQEYACAEDIPLTDAEVRKGVSFGAAPMAKITFEINLKICPPLIFMYQINQLYTCEY